LTWNITAGNLGQQNKSTSELVATSKMNQRKLQT